MRGHCWPVYYRGGLGMTHGKHTPGPWWSYTDDDRVGEYVAARPKTQRPYDNGKLIAQIYDEYRKLGTPGSANARLIAAAPDLLSELANLLDCVQTYAPEFMHGIPTKEHVQNARAAIARATGEKP